MPADSETVPHAGCIEIKILKGTDGRCYTLEAMRLTPRDANYVKVIYLNQVIYILFHVEVHVHVHVYFVTECLYVPLGIRARVRMKIMCRVGLDYLALLELPSSSHTYFIPFFKYFMTYVSPLLLATLPSYLTAIITSVQYAYCRIFVTSTLL